MAILVAKGYTIKGSWKAIVPYPLEPLLTLRLLKLCSRHLVSLFGQDG